MATAWVSASTFRGSDKRSGANGVRVRLAPQNDWEVNEPSRLKKVLGALEGIQHQFDSEQKDGKKVSLADLIVLGGCAGVEQAAKDAGQSVTVPFSRGRMDASQEQTDVASFAVLEPVGDGFRNYQKSALTKLPEEALVDRAQLLTLTAPGMTVLLGSPRTININYRASRHGVFTSRPGSLSNDLFVNLLDMGRVWTPRTESSWIFEGRDRPTGKLRWTGPRVDLIFGSNSQLRAISEVYACEDLKEKFFKDFVVAWHKVMDLDRFDLRLKRSP